MTATESPPGATPHGTGRGRLARSRLALLEYFAHTPGAAAPAPESSEAPPASGPTFWRSAREAACHYWEGHPARLLLALASPVISRPWKLISVSSVLLAALKSPHLSSLAMSILTRGGTRTRD